MFGKVAKNYIYNLLYQLLVLLVPLVTAPYLARVLGPDGNGAYSYVFSMTSIISTIVLLGIYNFGNREIAYIRDDADKISEKFWQLMSTRLILTIIGSIVYFLVVFFIGKFQLLFSIYYLSLLASCIDCTWLYVGVEDMKWAVIKNAIMKIISVFGIFVFIKSEKDLPTFVFIQGGSILFSNVLAYSQLGRYVKKPKLDFSAVKRDLIGSVLLFLPSLAATIYTQCDKVMLELLTGATNEVAFYDYSEKIVTIPLSFVTVLSTVMMPRIANEFKKGNKDTISSLIFQAAQFSLFLAFPMVFGINAVADKLVPWYLGNDFSPTIAAIQMISPIIITSTLTGISGGQFFTATNQVRILIATQSIAAVANIVINAILIPNYGFYGAAVATVMTSLLSSIIQYVFMLKQIKLPGLLKRVGRYCLVSIGMFIIIRLITRDMDSSPLTNVIQVVIGAGFYFGVNVALKDTCIWQIIDRILRKK